MKFKSFVFMITFIGIAAFTGLFFMKKPDGSAWLEWQDLASGPGALSVSNNTKVFRWKEDGSWSYAGEMPEHIAPEMVEEIEINPDTNLIQGLKPEPESEQTIPGIAGALPGISSESSNNGTGSNLSVPVPLTIQPDQLQKLFEDAKAIQQQMNNRTDNLDIQVDY